MSEKNSAKMEEYQHRMDLPKVYPLGKTYLSNNKEFYIRNDRITCMAAGDRHTIIVTECGRVYSFGDNNSGQLGFGHTDAVRKISSIKSLKFHGTGEGVILAACGQESSLVATNRGVLYGFGSNDYCQLGFESEESKMLHPHPVKIEYFDSKMSWKQISMGAEHACALTDDGHVYIWGSNRDGQCGQPRKHDIIRKPTKLGLEDPIIAISCGYYHTALINEKGRLFLFGNNSSRQLGRSVPSHSAGPLEVSFLDPVQAVACGGQHTVVLTDNGDVYTCGLGDCGQLGQGRRILLLEQFEKIENLPQDLTSIAAGKHHTIILGSHGDIYICGDDKHDQVTDGSHPNPFKPSPVHKFEKLNVLKVVCGGYQTITLAQNKPRESEGDLKRARDPESIPHESWSKRRTSEEFRSRILMKENGQILEIPSPETPITTRRNSRNHHISKPSGSDRTVPIITARDDVSTFNNRVLVAKKSSGHDAEMNHVDLKTTIGTQQNFNHERSSSESSLSSASEQITRRNFLNDENSHQIEASSDEDVHHIERRLSLFTNNGQSSSSTSSVHGDDGNLISKSMDGSLASPATEVDQPLEKTTVQSQSGFLSRIFGRKTSQKDSRTTSQNSRVCSLM